MKIIIPGGSGQVGTLLARAFQAGGHDVVVLIHSPETAPWRVVEFHFPTWQQTAEELCAQWRKR